MAEPEAGAFLGARRPARRGVGRPRSDAVDHAILAAAAELLAQGGFEALTVDAVAAQVRCSKATLYRRWPSKLRLAIDALAQLPDPPIPDRGALRADLREMLGDMLEIFTRTPAVAVMQSLIGERARNPELAVLLDASFRSRRQGLAEILSRGVERGELPARTDLEFVMDLIVGPILTRLFCTGASVSADFLDELVDATLSGCAPRPS